MNVVIFLCYTIKFAHKSPLDTFCNFCCHMLGYTKSSLIDPGETMTALHGLHSFAYESPPLDTTIILDDSDGNEGSKNSDCPEAADEIFQ